MLDCCVFGLSLIWFCWIVAFLGFLIFYFLFLGISRNGWETWDLKFFWFINRVSKTRFLGERNVEKMLHQMGSDHGNRFIGQNWVFKTRDASKKYSLKTWPTNYNVWKWVNSHFGRQAPTSPKGITIRLERWNSKSKLVQFWPPTVVIDLTPFKPIKRLKI